MAAHIDNNQSKKKKTIPTTIIMKTVIMDSNIDSMVHVLRPSVQCRLEKLRPEMLPGDPAKGGTLHEPPGSLKLPGFT